MLRRLLVALALAAFPSTAAAAPIVELGPGGKAVKRNDPFLSGPALTPAPATGAAARPGTAGGGGPVSGPGRVTTAVAKRKPARRKPQPTVAGVLVKMLHRNQISPATYQGYIAQWRHALGVQRKLEGTRRRELSAVTENLHEMAVSGAFTPTRLPALFLTLERNVQWWTTGPLLSSGERVEFAGSQIVWQYYPGQGIELQVLGTFGKADGLFTAGRSQYPAMRALLAEMIPLAVQRGGGATWEYYFHFEGGRPPWTSAMSQGTGLEALSRAYRAFHDPSYLALGAEALPIFSVRPPVGVELPSAHGRRFVQYSFAPRASIINAFLQTLIGLDDFATVSGSAEAANLFDAGNAEAQVEVPRFDTGAWSLYQPGVEDSLGYHQLVIGFLSGLCERTSAPVYCDTAQRFQADLSTPPSLSLLTARAHPRRRISVRFRLSKISHVGIVVSSGTRTVFETSATFAHGVRSFAIPPLRRKGTYSVRMAATDLAGNFAQTAGTLSVGR